MKVYMYYIVDKDVIEKMYRQGFLEFITPRYQPPDIPLLYAHTTDKKLSKKFKKTRNMDIFSEIIRHVDDEDYERWPSDSFRALRDSSLHIGTSDEVVLPLNGAERWSIENGSEILNDLFQKVKLPSITLFEDSVAEFLDILDYGFNSGSRYDGEIYDYDSSENLAISRGAWSNEFGMLIVFYLDLFNIETCIGGDVKHERQKNAVSDLCRWR